MSRVKKVYNLRRTLNLRPPAAQEESRVSEVKQDQDFTMKASNVLDNNLSVASQNMKDFPSKLYDEAQEYLVDGEELSVNRLQLNFDVPINDIAKRDVKIKNIGNSAIYVKFNFKNSPRINCYGFKDIKSKFYCHYENTVIKPGEEVTFFFSFISEFPGNFTEEVEISCQPPLKTIIPNLKLNGNASIKDEWENQRQGFTQNTDEVVLTNEVREILADVVGNVRLPPPPLPDVKDLKVAQVEFEAQNADLNLYFNQYLHGWFNELFNEICEKGSIPEQDRYWNQSVAMLRNMIEKASYLDEVDKKCFLDRLEHYSYLSMTRLACKSELYQTVYEFVSTAAYNLGGNYVDEARKELDMWEVPFREPLESDTEEELKARKDEVDKIKAEWLKRAKKKKWGEEDEKEMISQFKKKAVAKINSDILNRFQNFEEGAEFIKTREIIKKSEFKLEEYHKYLERVKTVRECPLDGKKVMIKWHLKLKENCDEKLKELEEYLAKKKEVEKRLEEEKKEGSKKKKTIKPKKKGQKEEEEEKPLVFDFMSLLDEENWNGFNETFKVVMEKQPFLVFIGITYGPRAGRHIAEYSVQFLLEHLRTIESAIEFFPHDQLPSLKQKLENQTIGEGSILLMENLNFLPWEVAQQEIVEPAAEEGEEPKITKRKLLQPEIRSFFDDFGESIDVLVNEDIFLTQLSGFTAYLNKQVIMGTQWWRYLGLSNRVIDSTIIFGDDFTANSYELLSRLAEAVKQIRLTGKAGLKFYMMKHNLDKLGNITLGNAQKEAIGAFLSSLEDKKIADKLKIPCDFVLRRVNEEQTQIINFDGNQENTDDCEVIDIGEKTVEEIGEIRQGTLFVLGETDVERTGKEISTSLVKILKTLFKKQEAKKERHAHQSSTALGIDYSEDLVIMLVGVDQSLVEKVDLKDKRVSLASEDDEEEPVEEEQQGENDRRKIELVSDFRLCSLACLYRLWNGRFDMGLKDISKYALMQDD